MLMQGATSLRHDAAILLQGATMLMQGATGLIRGQLRGAFRGKGCHQILLLFAKIR